MTVDREAIRARAEADLATYAEGGWDETRQRIRDVLALLDALDEAEARAERAEKAEDQLAAVIFSLRLNHSWVSTVEATMNHAAVAARAES